MIFRIISKAKESKSSILQLSEEDKQKIWDDYKTGKTFLVNDDDINVVKLRIYLYFGDDKGYLSIWDLTKIFEHYNIEKINSPTQEVQFNPKWKEDINQSAYFQSSYSKAQDRKVPALLDAS